MSLASTTGFVTADYEKWQPLAQFILFMLLFMGGCAGSTAGAMKAIRVLLFGKQAVHEFFRTVHPLRRDHAAPQRPARDGRA